MKSYPYNVILGNIYIFVYKSLIISGQKNGFTLAKNDL